MNTLVGRLLLVIMLLSALQAGAAEPVRKLAVADSREKRVALIIGNGKYPGMPLKNPANDARDMASALRKIGFDVIEKTDVTQKEMNRAITQFGSKLSSDSIALFFYAGHGMQVRGKNYLIPIDAQIENEASVRSETVDVDAVLDQLSASSLNVVILDACRNNPFERRFRSVGGGLAQMDAPKGTLIAYATSPGKVASDGEGRNGLYTRELLKVLQTPGLEVEKAFKRVRANVAKATGDNQIPWEASSLTGDFFFSRGDAAAGSAAGAPAAEPVRIQSDAEQEQEFWNRIKGSEDIVDFQDYLKQYPQGRFVAEARLMVRKLGAPVKQANAGSASARPSTPAAPSTAAPPPRARLGVVIQPLTPGLAKSFGLAETHGALVADVPAGSPALKAGIAAGDVIIRFQDVPIDKPAELPPMVASMSPGTTVALTAISRGATKVYSVMLASPAEAPLPAAESKDDPKFREFFGRFMQNGFTISQLTNAQQQQLRTMGFALEPADRVLAVVEKGVITRAGDATALASRLDGSNGQAEFSLLVQRGTYSPSFLATDSAVKAPASGK